MQGRGHERHHPGAFLAPWLTVWLVLQPPLSAAVITVSGGCTLVDAVTAANSDAVVGMCPMGEGADRIVLTNDVMLTVVDNTSDGANGLPSITSEITIQGEGRTVSRSSSSQFRVFHVASSGNLTLLDVTVSDGSVPGAGGGLFNRGQLALVHSTVSGNRTTTSASTQYAAGGGIYNAGGTVTAANTVIRDNLALGVYASGGGIENADGGSLSLTNSTVSHNIVSGAEGGYGGGIYNASGNLALRNTTLSGNRAGTVFSGLGGGLFNGSGPVTLTNTTLYLNTASVDDAGYGGGVYNSSGAVTIANSSLYGNIASANGASYGEALYNGSGGVTLTSSIVETAAYGAGANCFGTVTDGGYNFGSDSSCPRIAGISGGSIILSDNGGPVETLALYAGSNAIDQDAMCDLAIDAREALRDGACDSGAFEHGADDRFEQSGGLGTDDSCPGHRVPIGKAERHLHVEDAEDWIRFAAKGGATYEIKTSNLIWNSDTELELSEECGPPVMSDKDGGEGVASLITYTPSSDVQLDVRIRDEVGSSGRKGYDVEVNCIANCPPCRLPGGDSFELADETIVSYRRVEACTELVVAAATTVRSGAEVVLRAGGQVVVTNGLVVENGGRLVLASDPNLLLSP